MPTQWSLSHSPCDSYLLDYLMWPNVCTGRVTSRYEVWKGVIEQMGGNDLHFGAVRHMFGGKSL